MALFGRKKRRPRVLVIDDEADLRATVEMRFSTAGFDVLQAAGGEEGVEVASRERPDAIILDVNMPGMDGFETCRRLRAGRRTRHIPVIMLTACKRMGELEEGLHSGADTYLTKPFDGAELVDEVRQILAGKEAEPAPADQGPSRAEDLAREAAAKMLAAPRRLGEVAKAVPGILLGRHDERLLADAPETDQHRAILFESDVQPLASRRATRYLKFSENVARALCPDISVFEAPKKVLVRRTAPPVIAALDTDRRLVDKAVICVVPLDRRAKPEFLLAVLASRLAGFAVSRVIDRVRGGRFPWISPGELLSLPLPGKGGLGGRSYEDQLAGTAADLAKRAAGRLLGGQEQHEAALDRLDALVAEGYGLDPGTVRNLVSGPTP